MDNKEIVSEILKADEESRQGEGQAHSQHLTSFIGIREQLERIAGATDKSLKKPINVAEILLACIRFVRIKTEAQGQRNPLYFYDPDKGIYIEDDEFLLDLVAYIAPSMTERQAYDVLYKIARQAKISAIDEHYTAIGDKLYNSKKGEFKAFTPQIIATRKIRTPYKDTASEPNLNGWRVTEWLKGLFGGDEELYRLAIQIIKATVTGESLNKIFWLYGEGGTGKGTFQQLLINLAGMENVASLKITELNKSRFATSILLGKSLVIGDDVQVGANVADTSEMFSLATGDIMTIEEKGKKPYSIRLNMTVIQSSNGLPKMKGDEQAINRRFRILPFEKLKEAPNKRIKTEYINDRRVLEYLVKLAIETPLDDINPKKSQEELKEYHAENNPVVAFVESFFTDELESDFLPNSFVFHVWNGYAEYYKIKEQENERSLHRVLKSNLPPNWNAGQRTIPAGRQYAKGFYPKSDLPPYATKNYSNGRETPEKQKKARNERGYILGRRNR